MAYRKIQQETVRIEDGKKLACFFAFAQGPRFVVGKSRLRYEVRAGKKGTGQILAKANCVFGYQFQQKAIDTITKKLKGLEFQDENNAHKFPEGSLSDDN